MARYRIGLDVGSTTLKCVVLDENSSIIYKDYKRHYSQIVSKVTEMLEDLKANTADSNDVALCISGSAGMGLAENVGISFIQEVYATRVSVRQLLGDVNTVIEIGGEDAKILFLEGEGDNALEVRMNGTCAGGTGAFIDQMATLLGITPESMNELASQHEKIYTIASRCGVFAKSDIQPLLNQGARKPDIAASIFSAVVNQTVAGLAQGRTIDGSVVYLGGPLTFMPELRKSFDEMLDIKGICPENSLYYVALGSAFSLLNDADSKSESLSEIIHKVNGYKASDDYKTCPALFESETDYETFKSRHAKAKVGTRNVDSSDKIDISIGIDAGSTTVKCVAIDFSGKIVYSEYKSNSGNPVPIVKGFIENIYAKYPKAKIISSAVTGYGEDIIQNAFGVDFGLVETIAHFTAAKRFMPNVNFIIDIGGQDIKCFKIRNGAIDNIFLNEACSSGCGSFLQTFAGALSYPIDSFAKLGLFADKPVDLGSRCTVFMNSSVKQAQKDGASIENISAGLSLSVVKNALYKVIRVSSADDLGDNIVVQGGTFLNDAVLRAFESEIGKDVVRPNIAGLMGAYGAAIYSLEKYKKNRFESTFIEKSALEIFEHTVRAITCGGCPNNCCLTVNTFSGGKRFIGGNRCEKPITGENTDEENHLNMYEFKRKLLAGYQNTEITDGKTIGIPVGLNMFEMLPFWHAFFNSLGYKVVTSPESTRELYLSGQHTIPSDTACYPAKLIHGHIDALIKLGVKSIFYPCMTYNFDENLGDNHYNCPVVAYYPEVIGANVNELGAVTFIGDYIGPHRRKDFSAHICRILNDRLGEDFKIKEVKKASDAAFAEYESFMGKIRQCGIDYISKATAAGLPIIVLAGRPYHIDPEISHGIDKLICSLGAAVVTEEAVSNLVDKFPTYVLNQWTYHSRLYAAGQYITQSGNKQMNLVQLVSFGCGVDAVTTDEVRRILENDGRIYTQIKIDEITNQGAVKIRLRSLFAALS